MVRLPNLFLLTVDSLRADCLSCYELKNAVPTVNIDALAQDGEIYLNTMSCANHTIPSYAGLLTGRYPSSIGMKITTKLAESIETLPLLLSKRGYYTACLTGTSAIGPLNNLSKDFEFYQFILPDKARRMIPLEELGRLVKRSDRQQHDPADMLNSEGEHPGVIGRFKSSVKQLERSVAYLPKMFNMLGSSGSREIMKLMKELCDRMNQPLFILTNLFDPHSPYHPPRKYWRDTVGAREYWNVRRFNLRHLHNALHSKELTYREQDVLWRLYKGEVMYVDEIIGDFIDYLKKNGLYEDAMIVLLGDHGESIGDHGILGHWHTLYEELLHVPLVIKWPKGLKTGTVTRLVQNVDIFPTLLELLGMPVPTYVEGMSLLSDIDQERIGVAEQIDDPSRFYVRYPVRHVQWQTVMSEYNYTAVALRQGAYKYVAYSDGQRELFNLKDDPRELHNLAPEDEERVLRFENLLGRLKREDLVSGRELTQEEHELITQHLEDLGYI